MKHNTHNSYKKTKKRVGRGRASGLGKTSGRGHKGQKARSGKKLRAGFEGGQTPLFQRLPKYRGFKNINRVEYQVINVGQLDALKEKTIDLDILLKHNVIKNKKTPVKVLGNGEIKAAVTIHLAKASTSALEKISKAGGKFTSTAKTKSKEKKPAETSNEETKE